MEHDGWPESKNRRQGKVRRDEERNGGKRGWEVEERVEGKRKREMCEERNQVDTKVEKKERTGKYEHNEGR